MKLSDLADVQSGYAFRARLSHDPSAAVSVIQMKDIDADGRLQSEHALRMALPGIGSHHALRVGDLVFRSRGRTYGAVPVPAGLGTAVLAAPLLLLRPRKILPEYLCWFLNSPHAQRQLAGLAAGTSVQMISAEALRDLDVPLPPPERQQLIAELAAFSASEDRLSRRIGQLRQRLLAQRLLNLANEASA